MTPRSEGMHSGGFSLIESLVALMVVSAVLLVLAPVLFHAASQRVIQEGEMEVQAVLRGESNRLANVAFNALDAQAGCKSNSSGKLPHSRCISVVAVSSQERRLTVKVDPVNQLVPSDSLVMTRTNTRRNPFNTADP